MEGVNLIKVYCKHICKCHNVSPVQLLHANKSFFKKKIISDEIAARWD
jgi:hypothetical protein